MALTVERSETEPLGPGSPRSNRAAWIGAAGLASLGAGAIHAAAIGVHAEHRSAATTFAVLAALQLVWGVVALLRPSRVIALLGLVLGAAAVAGFAWAKISGIGFIDGLEVAEPIQTADGLAAALALVSAALATVSLRASATSGSSTAQLPMVLVAPAVVLVTMIGMVAAGTHVHAHGTTVETAGSTHDHGNDSSASSTAAGHDHAASAVAPVPYDPKKPIDLSGVPGVTPEQQAAAENIIAVTIVRLPKWSDWRVAEAAGFHSIGDAATGVEHFINEDNMDDDVILDPDKPESLVYDTTGGGRRLVAAMYMLKRGTPLADAPKTGGALMQWHVHNNLCFTSKGRVGGLTDPQGNCRPGLIKPVETPMIHVWIEPHACGPFAALEGIGGGAILPGEQKACDHVHGTS